ncbi:MAG: hypothetical protein EXR54_00830 [Dehalococcoidia bacterium]|nr:hypothetical protein [Dehalococcoidia bacterium]
MDVWVAASTDSPVDTVQVYLKFNPATLKVTDIAGYLYLDQELPVPAFDNSLGQVGYAAGASDTNSPMTEEFTLAWVEFEALDVTGESGTQVLFDTLADPPTKAIRSGNNRTGTLTDVTVVVIP